MSLENETSLSKITLIQARPETELRLVSDGTGAVSKSRLMTGELVHDTKVMQMGQLGTKQDLEFRKRSYVYHTMIFAFETLL